MNEIFMLKWHEGCKEHLCFDCQELWKKLQGMDRKTAEYAPVETTINFGGYYCGNGVWGEDLGIETEDNGCGFYVAKCKYYKKCQHLFKAVYIEYIESPRWKQKAHERMKKDGYKCVICGSPMNLHVHHLTYERLGCEDSEDLITICKKCHSKLHGKEET